MLYKIMTTIQVGRMQDPCEGIVYREIESF